jgi:hypothetical protein
MHVIPVKLSGLDLSGSLNIVESRWTIRLCLFMNTDITNIIKTHKETKQQFWNRELLLYLNTSVYVDDLN